MFPNLQRLYRTRLLRERSSTFTIRYVRGEISLPAYKHLLHVCAGSLSLEYHAALKIAKLTYIEMESRGELRQRGKDQCISST